MAFGDPIGIGEGPSLVLTVFAELVCGVLLALGLFTRAALIPLIVTMAVAVFIVHGPDPLADKEFAILYLVPYVALFFYGPGKFSLDRFMK
jgi:putative oxidoreductase